MRASLFSRFAGNRSGAFQRLCRASGCNVASATDSGVNLRLLHGAATILRGLAAILRISLLLRKMSCDAEAARLGIVVSPRFFPTCKFQYFWGLKRKDFHIIL
jgi:hypothetical protein